MKLGQKLYIGYSIPLATLVIMGCYALYSFRQIDYQVSTLYDHRVLPLKQLKIVSDAYAVDIIDAVNKVNANLLSMEDALRSVHQAEIDIQQEWQSYKRSKLDLEEEHLVNEIEKLFREANEQIQDLKQVLQDRKKSEIYQFTRRLYQVIDPITRRLNDLTHLQLQIASQERQEAALIYQQTLELFLPILALAILVGSPLGFLIIRRSMISTLESIINDIVRSSTEIAAVVEEQKKISLQQSNAVQQTQCSIESLNHAYQEFYQKAEHTVFYAQKSLSLMEQSYQSMTDIQAGMEHLSQNVNQMAEKMLNLQYHAEEISNISTLVSHLAHQTNVLALNARIEWVRSDTQNQGFSIIAAEIRSLAHESQKSASRIDQLVNQIETAIATLLKVMDAGHKRVEENVKITHKTTRILTEVNEMMHHVVLDNQASLNSAKEQEKAISQIVMAINQLHHAAQETTTGITQVKIGMENLKIIAEQLKLMV